MAIFKRGKFYWFEFTHNGRRIRESTKQADRETAKTLMATERTRLARVDGGIESPDPKTQERKDQSVSDLLDQLKCHYESESKASARNLSTIEQARKAFGEIKAADLSAAHIETYIRERLKSGRKKATINRVTEMVRRAYRIAEFSAPKIRHLSERDNTRKGFFSREEFDQVYSNLPNDLKDFALFAFLTAWRKGECASLTWADVEGDTIRLRAEHSKNREARSVSVAGELVTLIERRKGARFVNGVLTDLVFHRSGAPVAEFRKAWAAACHRAGVAGRLFHDLRRSGVRNLIRAGVSQNVAMKISGHKTASMFRRYDIGSEDDLRQAMLNLNKYHEAERKKVVSVT